MGINNIELPAVVIADLFHSALLEQNHIIANKKSLPNLPVIDTASDTNENKVKEWKSLGSNNKKILILVDNPDAVHLPDNELTFLTGVLSACNLSLADVAILNINKNPTVAYKELTTFFSTKIVLLFDIEPSAFGLPMSFPHFQIQAFSGNSFLYSPSLKSLRNDKILKSKLWICLKRLFNL